VPIRTEITSRSEGFCAQSAPPHAEQNTFDQPSGGSKDAISSSPLVTRNEPGATSAETAAAVPVRRWHRVQWQYPAETSGCPIS
jgi:hypothetical protein